MKSRARDILASEQDIVAAFHFFLGRNPSPPSLVDEHKGKPLSSLCKRLLVSAEFEGKVARALELRSELPQDRDHAEQLQETLAWAEKRLEVSAVVRERLTRSSSWRQALLLVTEDSFFRSSLETSDEQYSSLDQSARALLRSGPPQAIAFCPGPSAPVTKEIVRVLYELLLLRSPSKEAVAEKMNQSRKEVASKILLSEEFLERVLPRFLNGTLEEGKSNAVSNLALPTVLAVTRTGQDRVMAIGKPRQWSWLQLFVTSFTGEDSLFLDVLRTAQRRKSARTPTIEAFLKSLEALSKIDQLVEEGDELSAYLLARAHAENGCAYVISRLFVLTLALGFSPVEVRRFVSRFPHSLSRGLQFAVSEWIEIRATATADDIEAFASGIGCELPDVYRRLILQRIGRKTDNNDEVVDAFLTQLSLSNFAPTRRTEPAAVLQRTSRKVVSFCYDLGGINQLTAHFIEYLEQLCRGGSTVYLTSAPVGFDETILEDTQIQVCSRDECLRRLRAHRGHNDQIVVCSRNARLFSSAISQLLPSLLEGHPALRVSTATRNQQGEDIDDLYLGGLTETPSQDALIVQGASSLEAWLFGTPIQASASRMSVPSFIGSSGILTEASCLLVVESDETLKNQRLPTGSWIFSWSKNTLTSPEGTVEELDWTECSGRLVSKFPELPSLLLSSEIKYPASYVIDSIRIWERHGARIAIGTLHLTYNDKFAAFQIKGGTAPCLDRLIWLGASVLSFDVLKQYLADESDQGLARIIVTDEPLLVQPLLSARSVEPTSLLALQLRWEASLASRAIAFSTRSLQFDDSGLQIGLNSNTQELISSIMLPSRKLAEEAQYWIEVGPSDRENDAFLSDQNFKSLEAHGREDLVRAIILKALADTDLLRNLSSASLAALFSYSLTTGIQAESADLVFSEASAICEKHYNLILHLFELFAAALSEASLASALLVSTAVCISREQKRSIHRLNEVAQRYCSGDIVKQFLVLIDSSAYQSLFRDHSFAATIGKGLIQHERLTFKLENSGLDRDYFVKHAPPENLLTAAILHKDVAATVSILRNELVHNNSSRSFLNKFRNFTAELAEFELDTATWQYYQYGTQRDRLILATLLRDRKYIQRLTEDYSGLQDQDLAVASTSLGNFGVLNTLFSKWAEEVEIQPLSFSGASIIELFEHLATQRPLRSAKTTGRVSVITTVFEPDVRLLRLAILSILNQSHQDFEILLVDDHSTPEKRAEVAKIAATDDRIKCLLLDRNGGTYQARNAALAQATGRYVAIQDGDDFCHPNKLERQILELQKSKHLKLCTAPHLRFDRLGQLQFEANFEIFGDGMATSLYRREVFDEIGNFLPVRSRGDVEYRDRLKKTYGSQAHVDLPCPMLYCLSTPSNLSHRVHQEYLKLFRRAFLGRNRPPLAVQPSNRKASDGAIQIPWPLRP